MTGRAVAGDGGLPPAERRALIDAARAARGRAYAPYSDFAVGAALLAEDGTVVTGANVENASYGLSICAERAAAVAAVGAGLRRFRAIAVAGPGDEPVTPCGACRQFLREFPPGPGLTVLAAGEAGDKVLELRLGDLLPHSFAPKRLDAAGARAGGRPAGQARAREGSA